jgi:Holliday junction resolvase
VNSRRKGADGERELVRQLHEALGVRMVRNLEQSRRGGHDLIPDPDATGPVARSLARYAFEVKRHSRATPYLLKGWWAQSCAQAERVGLMPCLCYRENREGWRVVLPLAALWPGLPDGDGLDGTVTLSVAAFAAIVREGGSAPHFPVKNRRETGT